MRKEYFIVALGLFAAAGMAAADELAVPEADPQAQAAAPAALPAKGITMAAVKKQFGEPRTTRGPVGGDTPKHPPITRWDYDGFVVIFEKDRVVDAVVPGAPPRLRTTAGLTPASNAPPPPSMPAPDQPPMPEAAEAAPVEAAPAEPAPEAAPAEAEPIIPEAPVQEPAPPMEPTAEAPVAEPAPQPPAQQAKPAPVQSPVPADEYGDGPPTPK